MISKELLLDRINSHDLPTQKLTIKIEGALYQLLSKEREIIITLQEKMDVIIPERCNLFYLSDTTYSPPTQQYSLSFVVK